MTQEPHFFALGGGLDLETPPIEKAQGRTISSLNYEPRKKGYLRIGGFECLDGKPQPHKASYWVLSFDAGSAALNKGDSVRGATSTATGEALYDAVIESGSYGSSNAAGYLVLTNVAGTFQDNEALQVSGSTKGMANGVAREKGGATDNSHKTWLQVAIEMARGLIQAVPGSGKIRGVWRYNRACYAFRDNTGGTACDMWKSTLTGWQQVVLGNRISFTAGTSEIKEGETLTGGTSSATAVINRVVVKSGNWSSNDAAGYLVIGTVTGGPFQGETGTSVSGSATLSGGETANILQPGGKFEFRNHNFYGHSGGIRMYGVDGVSQGFEFDGSVFVPIATGMTVDTPKHLAIHKNHLFYSFSGGSVQHSGVGEPRMWSPLTGASEMGLGEEITGFLEGPALFIFGLNITRPLYGNDTTDWNLGERLGETGGTEWSLQTVIRPMMVEADKIMDVRATDTYENFAFGHLSEQFDELLRLKRKAGVTITASMKVRAKKQYRVYWSDGSGLVLDFSGRQPAAGALNYGKTLTCCCSVKDSDDEEWLLFGSDDGFVYRLDAGTSFNGAKVEAYVRLAFNHFGSPARNKKYHKVILECDATPDTLIKVSAEFSYGDPNNIASGEQAIEIHGGGGFWDELAWEEFYWDSQLEGTGRADIPGIGNNVSLALYCDQTYEEPHTMTGVTIYYSKLGLKK
ncbi:MAG: hypothetical protein GY835_11290 [bacterium]|nr:hypothetical protein [bacterium]